MKYLATVVITAVVTGSIVFIYFNTQNKEIITEINGVERTFGSTVPALMEDIELYRNLAGYLYLLDQESFDNVSEFGDELNDNQDLIDYITLIYTESIFNNSSETEIAIKNVIDKVKAEKTDTEYFNENTSCASLIQGIKTEIDTKDSKY